MIGSSCGLDLDLLNKRQLVGCTSESSSYVHLLLVDGAIMVPGKAGLANAQWSGMRKYVTEMHRECFRVFH